MSTRVDAPPPETPVVAQLSRLDRFLPVLIALAMGAGLLLGRLIDGLNCSRSDEDGRSMRLTILPSPFEVTRESRYRLRSFTRLPSGRVKQSDHGDFEARRTQRHAAHIRPVNHFAGRAIERAELTEAILK